MFVEIINQSIMGTKKLSVYQKREKTRRENIEKNLLRELQLSKSLPKQNFTLKELKDICDSRVSFQVLEEIIKQSDFFENLKKTDKTTRYTGYLVDIHYKFTKHAQLVVSEILLGGKKGQITSSTKKIKNAHMSISGYINIYVKSPRFFGQWTLTVDKIIQYLPNGQTRQIKLVDSPITHKINNKNDRIYDKLHETKL